MKKLTVIVQPNRLDNLKKKLAECGVYGMTISNVEGYGVQKRKVESMKNQDAVIEILPKAMVEMVLKEDEAEKIINAVIESVRSGRIGDGKIFVTQVDDAIRIRTGERGEDAL